MNIVKICGILILTIIHAFVVNDLPKENIPKLLLISYDGFRAKYIEDYNLPNFNEFIANGVYAKTKSPFTTLTFPNHYSMATGLNEEHHGIVGNSMYDKFINASFSMSCCNYDNRWWQQNPNVLPIWIANQQHSLNRKSGAIGFVGSLSPICGQNISRVLEYSNDRTFPEIVDTMIDWFTDTEPMNFIAMYFNEPDKTGHAYGPNSDEIRSKLKACDDLLGDIRRKMSEKGIWKDTNVVITTDHGMMPVDPNLSIVLEKFLDLSKCIVKNSLSIANIYTNNLETTIAIHQNLSGIKYFNAYFRQDVPKEFNYNQNIRIGDVVLIPDPGYLIFDTEQYKNTSTIRGTHGYNNSHPEMNGIFAARGPDIAVKEFNTSRMINLVDVYPFMERILQIPGRAVDGRYENIKEFLKN